MNIQKIIRKLNSLERHDLRQFPEGDYYVGEKVDGRYLSIYDIARLFDLETDRNMPSWKLKFQEKEQ